MDFEEKRNEKKHGRDDEDVRNDPDQDLHILKVLTSHISSFYSYVRSSWLSFCHYLYGKPHSLPESVSWVYVRFINPDPDELHQVFYSFGQLFYAFSLHMNNRCVPFPPLPDDLQHSATAVLDKKLYVIGGQIYGIPSRNVFVCDLADSAYQWLPATPTIVPRQKAVAASLSGKIYLFGGCGRETDPWAEVFDPSTLTWTSIPSSQNLSDARWENYFTPPLSAIVLGDGNTIIIRGILNGIAFRVTDASWSPISLNLIGYWWADVSAAVVGKLVFTCYDGHDQELCIRAYDTENDVWLKVAGLDKSFHENSHTYHFMSVDAKLVIYHMWDSPREDLRISIIEINEVLDTCVRVNLLRKFTYAYFDDERILALPAHSNSA